MSDTPTPGQIAYEAYCDSRATWWYPDFAQLTPTEQQVWDAVAQAVLAMKEKEDTPCDDA